MITKLFTSRGGLRFQRATLALVCALGVFLSFAAVAAAEQPGTENLPAKAGQRETFAPTDQRSMRVAREDFARLRAVAAKAGEVRVIVGLRTLFTAEGVLGESEVSAQRREIDSAREGLLRALTGTKYELKHSYESVPFVALSLSRGALEALERSGLAATLQEDGLVAPALADSTRLVEATEAASWGISRHGNGQTIAVIDSGVDRAHPFLTGKVVSEACYTDGDCPGGGSTSTSSGSGVPCTFHWDEASRIACRHGTHVAGIAVGNGSSAGVGFSGTAPSAKLISIQVFSRFDDGQDNNFCATLNLASPCALAGWSDVVAAVERVNTLRASFNIAAVNLSLDDRQPRTDGACDVLFPALKEAIDNLRSAGIPTVVSGGNSGSTVMVSAPSCISSVVTVGSTTKADNVATSSNSSAQVELLAPGSGITSSVPGGGFGLMSGTSMAAPHVAAAWAIMKQVDPTASVNTILSHLQATGKPITLPDNTANPDDNIKRARIRVLSASVRLKDTGFRLAFDSTARGLDVASNGVGLATRAGGPSSGTIVISGIPAGAVVTNAYLYWMTIGGADDTVVFQGARRMGELRGASRDTGWNVNELGPNRVYRAALPVSQVPGNGNYVTSGVGGNTDVDGRRVEGQGASLVIIYTLPTHGSPLRRVILREGALTAHAVGLAGLSMYHTFDGLNVPASGLAEVKLHVGVADGGAGTESPMSLRSSNVTLANFFSGSDGKLWDDHRIAVSPGALPSGTASATNTIAVGTDSLAWAYAALSFR